MNEANSESEHWMRLALEEAAQAAREEEVPIGAAAVLQGRLVVRDHNRSIQLSDPTAHAEMLVLRRAAQQLSNYRLDGLDVYVTIEPCAMCAGALIWARVSRLVLGARDEKSGALFSKCSLLKPGLFNHQVELVEGVLAGPCRGLLRDFFQSRR
ncbi:MAG: tRNA adenosine(34) deaminase TadA [Acidobacteriota bacterium]